MNEITKTPSGALPENILSSIVLRGDLSGLNESQKVAYYVQFCQRLGLDPATKPFDLMKLNGKEVLYCGRGGAAQLAGVHKVSHSILSREMRGDSFMVTAKAWTPDGRQTESLGAVSVAGLKGEALCNALLKAETKAKRRATLDLVSLGLLDESETEDVPHIGPPSIPPAISTPTPPAALLPPATTRPEAPPQAAVPPVARPETKTEVLPPQTAPEPPKAATGPKTVDLSSKGELVQRVIESLDKRGIPVSFAISIWRTTGVIPPGVERIHQADESALTAVENAKWMDRLAERWKSVQPAKPAPSPAPTPPPAQERAPSDESEGTQDLPFERTYAPGNPWADGRELDWQGTVVGFGKDAKLTVGEMGKQKFAWYYREWKPRPYQGKIDDNSYRLDAALVRAAQKW